MIRSPEDLCLLCKVEKSTKKNSHIVPKFMGKSILGKANKAVIIDSAQPHIKPKINQDSPKQHYILCPRCEKYFEVLETYFADRFFKRILNKRFSNDFDYYISTEGVEYVESKSINNLVFRLFFISVFWRSSIATIQPFSHFRIQDEEQLRQILMASQTIDLKSILNYEKCFSKIYDSPIVIVRQKNILNPESHFYYANSRNDSIYQLFLNEYIFFYSFDRNDQMEKFMFLNNLGNNRLVVGLLENEIWLDLTNGLNNLVNQKRIENAEKLGVQPFTFRK